MNTYCKKCKYGYVNFWGHLECWKLNQKIDADTTEQTGERENNALEFNKNNNCQYYISKNREIINMLKYGLINHPANVFFIAFYFLLFMPIVMENIGIFKIITISILIFTLFLLHIITAYDIGKQNLL